MKATAVWTAVFLGLALLRNLTVSIEPSKELVLVRSVSGNTAVIVRSTGAAYVIEKSAGCLALPQFEARRVVIDSSDKFLEAGSMLLIPELKQSCRIVTSRTIEQADTPDS